MNTPLTGLTPSAPQQPVVPQQNIQPQGPSQPQEDIGAPLWRELAKIVFKDINTAEKGATNG